MLAVVTTDGAVHTPESVIDSKGKVVGHRSPEELDAICKGANDRAVALGIQTRYQVTEV